MQAAGIAGPYYPQTKTYSKSCVMTLGTVLKGGGLAVGSVASEKLPPLVTNAAYGYGGKTIGRIVGNLAYGIAEVASNPVVAASSLLYGMDEVMARCEVRPAKPTCEQ